MLKPDRGAYTVSKEVEQKIAQDRRAQDCEWCLGLSVMVRNLGLQTGSQEQLFSALVQCLFD